MFRDDRGFTVTELLVVCGLIPLVLGMAYFVMAATNRMTDDSIAHAVAADESQVFIDRVGRELREAQEAVLEPSSGAFSEIGARRCVFYSDVTGDAIPERVTYFVSDGAVYRTQALCSDTAPPFTHFGAESSPAKKIVSKLDPAWSGAIFTYYNTNNVISSTIPDIARVNVLVRACASSGPSQAVSQSQVTARVRSVQNSLGGG